MTEVLRKQADLVGKIVEAIDKELVSKTFKNALDGASEAVTDSLTDYLKDEYRLQLGEYIENRAREMVRNLLKGDMTEARVFELICHEWHTHDGTIGVTDDYGVRAAVVEQFRDQILTAETISLREENERLRKALEYSRR